MPTYTPAAEVLLMATEHYADDINSVIFESEKEITPLFAMCESKEERDGFGRGLVLRSELDEGAAVAGDPAAADAIDDDGAAGGQPGTNRFVVTPVTIDAPFSFTRADILGLEKMGKDEAFDVVTSRMDMAIKRIRNRLARDVSGDGWGVEAQISAQSGTTVTVALTKVNRFKIGDRLAASATSNTDVLLGSPTYLRVTGVNPSTGVLTLSGTVSSSWSAATDLYLFRYGNRLATDPSGVTSTKQCITGLAGWIGTEDIFGSSSRSGDPRLTGHIMSLSSYTDVVSALINLAERAFYFGRPCDTMLVAGDVWKALQLEKDGVKTVDVKVGEYKIGYKALSLPTVYGDVQILPDAFFDAGVAVAGPFNDKKLGPKLYHAGSKLINLENLDGIDFLRNTSAGARKFGGRFYYYGNMTLEPGAYVKGTGIVTT